MDVVAFTRQLVDIESITGNEAPVGDFLHGELDSTRISSGKNSGRRPRCNVFATAAGAIASCRGFLNPHGYRAAIHSILGRRHPVYGRGSCDAKGIIAVQVAAAERLRGEGVHVGMLFLVGEERDSLGAKVANQTAYRLEIPDQR